MRDNINEAFKKNKSGTLSSLMNPTPLKSNLTHPSPDSGSRWQFSNIQ